MIGGTSAGDANVISGNFRNGIDIVAPCLVEGNLIGTNSPGSSDISNRNGITVGSAGATIGGTSAGAGNVISGNVDEGIDIEASCLVEGNLIGTNEAGTNVVANINGIIVGSAGATIGGTSAGAGNVISGNVRDGIEIDGAPCLVEGNMIGTDRSGATQATSVTTPALRWICRARQHDRRDVPRRSKRHLG